ncbi:HNH endonuclease [Streptomyces sp. AJS327]|nr:HNH endonuclease [Streptomyces sp. AJS327]
MAWEGSTRRASLPADWPKRRALVLKRDGYQCTATLADGQRCTAPATDVDHAVARDVHDVDALASLCGWCHQQKTAREAADGRRRAQGRRPSRWRPESRHPGEL